MSVIGRCERSDRRRACICGWRRAVQPWLQLSIIIFVAAVAALLVSAAVEFYARAPASRVTRARQCRACLSCTVRGRLSHRCFVVNPTQVDCACRVGSGRVGRGSQHCPSLYWPSRPYTGVSPPTNSVNRSHIVSTRLNVTTDCHASLAWQIGFRTPLPCWYVTE